MMSSSSLCVHVRGIMISGSTTTPDAWTSTAAVMMARTWPRQKQWVERREDRTLTLPGQHQDDVLGWIWASDGLPALWISPGGGWRGGSP